MSLTNLTTNIFIEKGILSNKMGNKDLKLSVEIKEIPLEKREESAKFNRSQECL